MTAKVWVRASITAALLAVATSVASAQQSVSTSDIQRLQDQVYQAGSDVTRLRSTDSTQASRLETELDDLRDEVVYLKVKLRKDGTVSRSEYADRARPDLRRSAPVRAARAPTQEGSGVPTSQPGADRKARAAVAHRTPTTAARPPAGAPIPVGQEIDVRLQTS